MSNFTKPVVTIDLEEYQFLQNKIKELELTENKITYDVCRGIASAMLGYIPQIPNVSVEEILALVTKTVNNEILKESDKKVMKVELYEDTENPSPFMFVDIKMHGK